MPKLVSRFVGKSGKLPDRSYVQARIIEIIESSTGPIPGAELFERVYKGCKKPDWSTFQSNISHTNKFLEREGYSWRIDSTAAYTTIDAAEYDRKYDRK
jgi:hypothetical protein